MTWTILPMLLSISSTCPSYSGVAVCTILCTFCFCSTIGSIFVVSRSRCTSVLRNDSRISWIKNSESIPLFVVYRVSIFPLYHEEYSEIIYNLSLDSAISSCVLKGALKTQGLQLNRGLKTSLILLLICRVSKNGLL